MSLSHHCYVCDLTIYITVFSLLTERVMWANVIILHPSIVIICNLFTFQSSSPTLMSQLGPNFVGICFGWFFKSLCAFFWSKINISNKRPKCVNRGIFCFYVVNLLFFNQLWWIIFFKRFTNIFCIALTTFFFKT